ncbi:MAG: phosphoribosylformylglycinamidine synthase subunit PurQ [Acidimicrobiia bacterium]|nr:phosphoribosylformylglycinamidine synthase subunit PurQ [Acidimicrobiia bacterium]MXZ86208.1 phosphoribosylformylglycinamidine synthase subunit PurQ [Acidimicrobiia bacterium]MYB09176.1 phosphoribosylformylglycinamidine synthase subunit PurQ [Acidimicrobiia bacterium]MYB74801.1 phosphoribosylformylglycinamidine synthase subunit PurQ [Acidimicrobiia bacterium]MYG57574.1 phosphoribosylformylglycinamidine synthase subunit PurQ [Acidimicrobiia bacterium]
MTARVGVVVFPGSNCEHDVVEAIDAVGGSGELLWHKDNSLGDVDAVVLPGGFAHGDYLRTGAMARFSPIMDAVARFAQDGGPVVGICNGFQILTEAQLLPGALYKNQGLKFLCEPAVLRVESTGSVLTQGLSVGDEINVPINHFEGNFICSEQVLSQLRDKNQIVLTYRDNPNGATADIAGICNENGNVVGLMPHPERAAHPLLGSTDGAQMLKGLIGID